MTGMTSAGVNGKTSGQVFRETLLERWTARGRPVDSRPWDALPEVDRDDMDAAALAAIAAKAAAGVAVATMGTEGGVVVIAFQHAITAEQGAEVVEHWERYAPGVSIVVLADVAEVASYGQDVTRLATERDELRERADDLDVGRKAWRATAEALRALVTEIIGAVEAFAEGVQPITAGQLAEWHERAGDVTCLDVLPPPPAPDTPHPAGHLAQYLGELADRYADSSALVPAATARDLAAAAELILRTLMRTNSAPGTMTSAPGRVAGEILTAWSASAEAAGGGTVAP